MDAIDASNAETLFRAAEIFEELGDQRTAFKCLSVAAGLGHDSSQLQLGNVYASGRGTRKNLKLAAKWYRKAYRGGNVSGAFNLAIDKRDRGDRKAAIGWFRRAAAQNHGGAMIELAKLYRDSGAARNAADLLQRALLLSRDDIDDNERKEARALLRTVTNRPTSRR